MYEGLYFKLMLVALVFWLIIFWRRKGQRMDMLITGVLAAVAGPIQELFYTKDYWHPDYIGGWPWIEDILFGFAVVGILSALYEIVFYRRIKEIKMYPSHSLVFVSVALMASVGMILFMPFMNSIYAASLSFVLAWILTIIVRPDLLKLSLANSFLVTVLAFVSYESVLFFKPNLINAWWELNNISGILILHIPLEEYLWFFTMGLALGPFYELLKGIAVIKKPTRIISI